MEKKRKNALEVAQEENAPKKESAENETTLIGLNMSRSILLVCRHMIGLKK